MGFKDFINGVKNLYEAGKFVTNTASNALKATQGAYNAVFPNVVNNNINLIDLNKKYLKEIFIGIDKFIQAYLNKEDFSKKDSIELSVYLQKALNEIDNYINAEKKIRNFILKINNENELKNILNSIVNCLLHFDEELYKFEEEKISKDELKEFYIKNSNKTFFEIN